MSLAVLSPNDHNTHDNNNENNNNNDSYYVYYSYYCNVMLMIRIIVIMIGNRTATNGVSTNGDHCKCHDCLTEGLVGSSVKTFS